MRIVTWNEKGLSDRQKAIRVIHKLRKLNADIIILQEIFINNKNLNPNELSLKVDEIARNISLKWNSDLYFEPNGHLAILSTYKHSLKPTTSYHRTISFRLISIPSYCASFQDTSLIEN